MFTLSDDDSQSTQLEGKKLKNRGVKTDKWSIESEELEIDENTPGLLDGQGIDDGQEYFIERELGQENEQEREERLKRELQAARRQQQEMQKQQQRDISREPMQQYQANERAMMQSRNKGKPTTEIAQKMNPNQEEVREAVQEQAKEQKELKKTDVVGAAAVLGKDNIKNLDLSDDKKLAEQAKGSIPATQVPDIRSGGKDQGLHI